MIEIVSSHTWWTAARWALGFSGAVVAAAAACSWLWRAVRRVVLARRDRRSAEARVIVDALSSRDPAAAPDASVPVPMDEVFLTCLADALDRSSDDLRVRLAAHAERFGYVERFRALSRSPRSRRRLLAARWLGRLQHRDGVPDLIRLAEDRSLRVRAAAVAALGAARDGRAQSALAALLDGHASVQPRRAVPVHVLTQALVAHGADGISLALSRLQSPSAAVRAAAADVLASASDPPPRARVSLLAALDDVEGEVRARAAKAIGRIGDAGAAVPLIKALTDPVWFVRLQAAKAIGALAYERAVRALVTALTDEAWQVRAAAAEALRRVGGPAVSALTECLFESRDRYAKEQVVEELQRTSLLLEQVEALDGTHAGAAFAAQRFLREMARHGATSMLVDALRRHPRAAVRRRLVAVLGVVDAPRVIAALHDVAEHDRDAGVREASHRALTGRPDRAMGRRADRERAA
ncbi:MAG: HEAT repeat domain-containing protein [Nitrospirota bacterium]